MAITARQIQLDMLATMAEDWSDTTSAMISVSIALVMLQLQTTTVEVALHELKDVMAKYIIDRTYFDKDGVPMMRVTLIER